MAAGTVELAAEFGLTISHITEQGGHNKVNKQQLYGYLSSAIFQKILFLFLTISLIGVHSNQCDI